MVVRRPAKIGKPGSSFCMSSILHRNQNRKQSTGVRNLHPCTRTSHSDAISSLAFLAYCAGGTRYSTAVLRGATASNTTGLWGDGGGRRRRPDRISQVSSMRLRRPCVSCHPTRILPHTCAHAHTPRCIRGRRRAGEYGGGPIADACVRACSRA